MSNRMSFIFVRTFVFGIALLTWLSTLATTAAAQEPEPVSPPIANPNDQRFKDVTEDWTTPSLSNSHLMPASPVDLVDDSHPGYTLELLQLQWRWGDPLDVYVLKPRGVKKPPVILNLYGYPTDTDPYKNEIFQNALTKDGFAAVGFVWRSPGIAITTGRCGSGSSAICRRAWARRRTTCKWYCIIWRLAATWT